MLGVFVLAFFAKRVGSNAAFCGVLAGEAAIFAAAKFTDVAFLWYNVIGCVVVVAVALAISAGRPASEPRAYASGSLNLLHPRPVLLSGKGYTMFCDQCGDTLGPS